MHLLIRERKSQATGLFACHFAPECSSNLFKLWSRELEPVLFSAQRQCISALQTTSSFAFFWLLNNLQELFPSRTDMVCFVWMRFHTVACLKMAEGKWLPLTFFRHRTFWDVLLHPACWSRLGWRTPLVYFSSRRANLKMMGWPFFVVVVVLFSGWVVLTSCLYRLSNYATSSLLFRWKLVGCASIEGHQWIFENIRL